MLGYKNEWPRGLHIEMCPSITGGKDIKTYNFNKIYWEGKQRHKQTIMREQKKATSSFCDFKEEFLDDISTDSWKMYKRQSRNGFQFEGTKSMNMSFSELGKYSGSGKL